LLDELYQVLSTAVEQETLEKHPFAVIPVPHARDFTPAGMTIVLILSSCAKLSANEMKFAKILRHSFNAIQKVF
jgi:hypothetical protein